MVSYSRAVPGLSRSDASLVMWFLVGDGPLAKRATEGCASGGLYHAADPEDESFGRALCWFIAGPMPRARTASISSQPARIMAVATPAWSRGKSDSTQLATACLSAPGGTRGSR